MNSADKPNIVLVGAGHAHLHTIKRVHSLIEQGVNVTVVSPDKFWYSGLATGMLGGMYSAELDQVDVAALVRSRGASIIAGALQSIDHKMKSVILQDGTCVPFDVLSLNIGSASRPLPGENERCYQVKPIRRLYELRQRLEREFASPSGKALDIAVAGGGITAFEIAGNVKALAERFQRACNVTILCGSQRPLSELAAAAAERVIKNFSDRGIRLSATGKIVEIDGRVAKLRDNHEISFDFLVNATGLIADTIGKDLGIPLDSSGGILVDDTLRSPEYQNIFAVGDCATFASNPLPKIGVYAIRQSPILFHNIQAMISGVSLRQFVPQKLYLSIITLGDGNGLATRGSWWYFGRAAFLLKDWIDRRFLSSIQPT
ncbi:MAG: FAD-dependent oxidoreductase [Rhizobiales bacterium]|nr:FAD-dependent oxidoreductase [Hyphomicrobiales bacterium]